MLLQPIGRIVRRQVCKLVSIPQAVSAVATQQGVMLRISRLSQEVSIPQAVSAVATAGSGKPVFMWFQKLVLENLKP